MKPGRLTAAFCVLCKLHSLAEAVACAGRRPIRWLTREHGLLTWNVAFTAIEKFDQIDENMEIWLLSI